jgi:hypothetical protein
MNFYQCIATGLGGTGTGIAAETVHHMCLMHFARIIFSNVGSARECISQVYDSATSKELVLREAGMVHAAVKAWIERINATQPHMHKDPRDWYHAYPKVLKGYALRFLYYHRKPHRIMCMRVFAHLAAEIFCCRVGLTFLASDDAEWIYPIDSEDYFVDMAIKSILIRKLESGFLLISDPTSYCVSCSLEEEDTLQQMEVPPLLTAVAETPQPPPPPPNFMLRRYSKDATGNHLNVKVGMFQALSAHVHVIKYQPMPKSPLNMQDHIYQVYPGDETRTYYTLPTGCALFVYRLAAAGDAPVQLAQTAAHDEYLYFSLPVADTRGILAVCAPSAAAATELIASTMLPPRDEGHNKPSS